MRLLFDQNLSPNLVTHLSDGYPGSTHVSHVGLGNASDSVVWDYARDQGYCIVSKDADFSDLSVLRGHPPKVVWVRRGNCSTVVVADLLTRHHQMIKDFDASDQSVIIVG